MGAGAVGGSLGQDAGQGFKIERLAENHAIGKTQGVILWVKGVADNADPGVGREFFKGCIDSRTIAVDQDDPSAFQVARQSNCVFPVAFDGKSDQSRVHAADVEQVEGGDGLARKDGMAAHWN